MLRGETPRRALMAVALGVMGGAVALAALWHADQYETFLVDGEPPPIPATVAEVDALADRLDKAEAELAVATGAVLDLQRRLSAIETVPDELPVLEVTTAPEPPPRVRPRRKPEPDPPAATYIHQQLR